VAEAGFSKTGIGELNQSESALSKDVAEMYQKACRGMPQNISLLDYLLEGLLALGSIDACRW